MRRVPAVASASVILLGFAGSAADASSNLGGGLLEFLAAGGGRPNAGVIGLETPQWRAPGATGAGLAPPSQMASIAPQEPTAVRREIPAEFHRQDVAYDGKERAGVIVIDTPNKYLYLVEPDGRAMRYGIGVGRPGFEWSGTKVITRKAEWPDWTPPAQMLLRRPDLPRHMDGGPENPLGARALYLGSSMYRIHGTNEPWTIGQNVSSGCIRMMNEDVEDLYERVKVGTKVIIQ